MKTTENSSPFITPELMAKAVNEYAGEDRVRWNCEFQCFTTIDGTRYQPDTIEDVFRGIKRDEEKANGD